MRLMMPQRELKSPGSWAGMIHRAGWIQQCNDLLLNVVAGTHRSPGSALQIWFKWEELDSASCTACCKEAKTLPWRSW